MSLPINNASGSLTEEQKQLVEDNIDLAQKAARWLSRGYQCRGLSQQDADSDAQAWLVYSALRYDGRQAVKFSTYFWSNIKWWRSDIRSKKTLVQKQWAVTKVHSHIAACSSNQIDHTNFEFLADDNNRLEKIDQGETNLRIMRILYEHCPHGRLLWDSLCGMSYWDIAKKHKIKSKGAAFLRIQKAKKFCKDHLYLKLFGKECA